MTMRLLRHLLVTAVLLTGTATADAATGIRWYTDLAEASGAAQKADLPMFIDFWADWCAACKVMDKDVYTDPEVIRSFEERIIGVRIHFDLQQELARRYKVPALPFLLFTTSHGTPLIEHRGYLDAKTLTAAVKAMPPLGEINRIERTLQHDKNDFASLVSMGRALREAGFYEVSSSYYDRAAKHPAAKTDDARRESVLVGLALNALEMQNGKAAAETLERCLQAFPNSPRRPDLMVALGRAYALDMKMDKARSVLTAVISEFPQSPAASQARSLLESL